MRTKSKIKMLKDTSLTDIKTKMCTNPELSNQFISDFLKVSGYDVDSNGYIINTEEDPENPEFIMVKNKFLRLSNKGILHNKDTIFDPYNNNFILEELFRSYLQEFHPDVLNFQIMSLKEDKIPRLNTLGYIVIMYNNGDKIQTNNHYKDSTKLLDAYMKMESYNNNLILELLYPYDTYEREYFKNLKSKV